MLDVLLSFLCHLRNWAENPATSFMPAEKSSLIGTTQCKIAFSLIIRR